jgi:hypothetical protein
MKITPLILCFLLIKATVFACGASDGCSSMDKMNDSMEVSVDIQEMDQGAEDDQEKDCCGDSCDCLCCAMPVMNLIKMDFPQESKGPFSEANFIFSKMVPFEFHLRILQPPQLV